MIKTEDRMSKKKLSEIRNIRKEQMRRADDRFTWRILGVLLTIGIWTFLYYRFEWHPIFYLLPVGAAVLYLLAYIYPRDFTVLAVLISGSSMGMWLLSVLYQRSGRWNLWLCILFAAAILISALFFMLLRKNGGVLNIGKKTLTVIPRKGRYVFLFLACAVLTLSLACALLFGRSAAMYAITAKFCYLFIAAVYYTVKLI
jgi:hypothetical protein